MGHFRLTPFQFLRGNVQRNGSLLVSGNRLDVTASRLDDIDRHEGKQVILGRPGRDKSRLVGSLPMRKQAARRMSCDVHESSPRDLHSSSSSLAHLLV